MDGNTVTTGFTHIGIAGLGLLGRGIVACLLGHGHRVTGLDVDPEAHVRAARDIPLFLAEMVEHLDRPKSVLDTWQDRYIAAEDVSQLATCDLVIESIFEDHAAKAELFARVEDVVSDDAIIASNTSAIPISTLQTGRAHPERFVGLHWLEPAYASIFIEVIRGQHTSQQTLDAAVSLARSLGKRPVVVKKDVVGFVGNRLWYAILREAIHLVETGVADFEMIDQAMQNSPGTWVGLMGPFRSMDLNGIAAYAAAMKDMFPDLCNSTEVPRTMLEHLEEQSDGPPKGKPFYDYKPNELEHWHDLQRQFMWEGCRLVDQYARRAEAWRAKHDQDKA